MMLVAALGKIPLFFCRFLSVSSSVSPAPSSDPTDVLSDGSAEIWEVSVSGFSLCISRRGCLQKYICKVFVHVEILVVVHRSSISIDSPVQIQNTFFGNTARSQAAGRKPANAAMPLHTVSLFDTLT